MLLKPTTHAALVMRRLIILISARTTNYKTKDLTTESKCKETNKLLKMAVVVMIKALDAPFCEGLIAKLASD